MAANSNASHCCCVPQARFDAEYDETGEGGDTGRRHYEDLKKEVDAQTVLNKGEFEGMDDALRVQYEGFRPGMYVRMEIRHVGSTLNWPGFFLP